MEIFILLLLLVIVLYILNKDIKIYTNLQKRKIINYGILFRSPKKITKNKIKHKRIKK